MVSNHGELIVVEDKTTLMRKMGKKQLRLQLNAPITTLPVALADYHLELNAKGDEILYTYDTQSARTGITRLLQDVAAAGIQFRDLNTHQDTLEQIFVELVRGDS